MKQSHSELPEVAKRLNWLFENVLKVDGNSYTHLEVEQGTELNGFRVATTSTWKIRHGQIENPGYQTLRAIAEFFGVPVTFFYEPFTEQLTDSITKDLSSNSLSRTREIALRAKDLSDEDQKVLLDIINAFRKRSDSK